MQVDLCPGAPRAWFALRPRDDLRPRASLFTTFVSELLRSREEPLQKESGERRGYKEGGSTRTEQGKTEEYRAILQERRKRK